MLTPDNAMRRMRQKSSDSELSAIITIFHFYFAARREVQESIMRDGAREARYASAQCGRA
jgi:hypothetical protein